MVSVCCFAGCSWQIYYVRKDTVKEKKYSATKRKLPPKIVVRNVAILVFSLIFIAAGGLCVYGEVLMSRMNYVDDGQSTGLFESTKEDETSSGTEFSGLTVQGEGVKLVNGLYHDDMIINVLVMGVDDYQPNDVGRTDSMMLVSLDTRHKKLKVTSLMRDMYVAIPGRAEPNRINTADSTGGPEGLVATVEANFKIDVDRWVVVTFDAFEKIIDAMGGVDITLSQEEADQINHESGDPRHNLSEGTFTLSGKQARYYSRIRKISTGGDDFMRTQRQRNVMNSIVTKFKSSDIGTINTILYNTLPLITTNMQKNEILGLAANALEYLNYEFEQERIPGDNEYSGEWVVIGGWDQNVLVPDLDAAQKRLVSFIFEAEVS